MRDMLRIKERKETWRSAYTEIPEKSFHKNSSNNKSSSQVFFLLHIDIFRPSTHCTFPLISYLLSWFPWFLCPFSLPFIMFLFVHSSPSRNWTSVLNFLLLFTFFFFRNFALLSCSSSHVNMTSTFFNFQVFPSCHRHQLDSISNRDRSRFGWSFDRTFCYQLGCAEWRF